MEVSCIVASATAGLLIMVVLFWYICKKIGSAGGDSGASTPLLEEEKEEQQEEEEEEETVGENFVLRGRSLYPPPPLHSLQHTSRYVPHIFGYNTFKSSVLSSGNSQSSKQRRPSYLSLPPIPHSLGLSSSVPTPLAGPSTASDNAAAAAGGTAAAAVSSERGATPSMTQAATAEDSDEHEVYFDSPRTWFFMKKLVPKPQPPEADSDITKHITK